MPIYHFIHDSDRPYVQPQYHGHEPKRYDHDFYFWHTFDIPNISIYYDHGTLDISSIEVSEQYTGESDTESDTESEPRYYRVGKKFYHIQPSKLAKLLRKIEDLIGEEPNCDWIEVHYDLGSKIDTLVERLKQPNGRLYIEDFCETLKI